MRIEESPELFGGDAGTSTCGKIHCAFCETTYNLDDDDDGGGMPIGFTGFAGKRVCENCFEDIEREVLARMPQILPWYRRHVERSKQRICTADANLKALGA